MLDESGSRPSWCKEVRLCDSELHSPFDPATVEKRAEELRTCISQQEKQETSCINFSQKIILAAISSITSLIHSNQTIANEIADGITTWRGDIEAMSTNCGDRPGIMDRIAVLEDNCSTATKRLRAIEPEIASANDAKPRLQVGFDFGQAMLELRNSNLEFARKELREIDLQVESSLQLKEKEFQETEEKLEMDRADLDSLRQTKARLKSAST
ncbi:hypothetical protein EJ08DRAFT_485461 [Tothia fuscella]|uniref:Uncharacterized protein n=1 Tax=Tothia fuscella TaxID=1048955 RepID=A0A9P4NHK7_9PEZI|nr:hypothetical protein EJ08DRAFT_485461 [Tothia fuscella]